MNLKYRKTLKIKGNFLNDSKYGIVKGNKKAGL